MELDSVVSHEDFIQSQQSEMDKRLLVKFMIKPWQDKAATVAAGRPVYVDREYVSIRTPGTRNHVARPATTVDKARFAAHYEAFKKRIAEPLEGTPLTEWPLLPRSAVENMAFLHIKTVEQLANVADSASVNYKGLLNWKRRAQEWLELAESDAPLIKMSTELEQRDAEILAQKNMIENLTRRLDELEARQQAQPAMPEQAPLLEPEVAAAPPEPPPTPSIIKRRRGRPRKNPVKE